MDMTRFVNTFGRYLRGKYGEKVHKISVNASFTCPNRDGTKGIGGCTFCNNASFSPKTTEAGEISEQVRLAKERVMERTGARKFMVSIKNVAKEASVSTATVSRVINPKFSSWPLTIFQTPWEYCGGSGPYL